MKRILVTGDTDPTLDTIQRMKALEDEPLIVQERSSRGVPIAVL